MKTMGNYQLLSTHPLWILDDENHPVVVQNKYDNLEMIRVYDNGNTGKYNYCDYPIEPLITYVPELGVLFFKTYEDAIRYASLMSDKSGVLTIFENGFEASRHNKVIVEFDEHKKVKNGVYTIAEYDDALIIPDYEWIHDIHYISEKGVEKVKHSDENINFYLHKYMNMIDIETRHNLENERLFFEVYSECGKVYINHFFIRYHQQPVIPFYFTRIMNYVICSSKSQADAIKSKTKNGGWDITTDMFHIQSSIESHLNDQARKEARKEICKKVIQYAGSFVWDHLDDVLNWGKKKYRDHKTKKLNQSK